METRRWAKRVLCPWGLALIPLPLILLALIFGNSPISSASAQIHAPTQIHRDWGDAAETYPTTSASDGARHILGSDVYLGNCVDAEADGQPTYNADGDDTHVGSPVYGTCAHGSDEDGVTFVSPLFRGRTADIVVVANEACTLSAWMDFDSDGDWEDAGDDLFPGGQALAAGANPLTFTVPSSVEGGLTHARFRCTTDGPVSYTGEASDGEVEDYAVRIISEMDFGDAPDPPYPTLYGMEVSGAYHYLGSDVYLGSCVDAEMDGQPTQAADGDDVNSSDAVYGTCEGGDDEDGVTFTSDLLAGQQAQISVVANDTCTLTAWIDFNRDGDWWDDGEALFPGGQQLTPGVNFLSFSVPLDVTMGLSYARFRCASEAVDWPDGYAFDGEVEDYRVRLGPPLDFGDAPDPGYPTLETNGGAVHALGSDIYLGACVDAELDGQPTLAANGDDLSTGSTVFGTCTENDDEDGVTFTTDLLAGEVAEVDVVATGGCMLSAWLDVNADGDWWDNGEELFPGGRSVVSGTNTLSFTVPGEVVEGPTYARFRCTTDVVDGPVGFASDGEVEDYQVRLGPPLDFGDAPDPTYPTLITNTGANHVLGSEVYLGACVDAEFDGQPAFPADDDDVAVGSLVFGTCGGNDDEDGVTFTTDLLVGEMAEVDVVANAACTLSAWVDFNADGDWADAGESLFPGGRSLAAGSNALSFAVPAGAVEGFTHARFRCTTAGAVAFAGPAPDGEVEDYRVSIGHNLDLGDVPDPSYPTLLASAGASHVLGTDVYLGRCVDAEPDGQPTSAATGDDTNVGSPVFGSCVRVTDEDGVAFVTPPYVGGTASIVVVANSACTLSAWVDFNADGDWADAGESLFPGGQALAAGPNSLSFVVPTSAIDGTTYARFRCTTDGAVSFTGEASDGEVEDYQVAIGPPVDFGDAPDPGYATLSANGGASHVLGSDVYLGSCADAEGDGQPTLTANGDDTNAGTPVFGACAGGDDEDGVTFTSNLLAGQEAGVEVVANADCTLSAWVDFNADGDWLDAGESLFPGGQALAAGSNSLSFAVPAGAVEGETYARFRCTTYGPVTFAGPAPDGEVEDYRVTVGPSADFGDALGSHYPTLVERSGASHALGSDVYLGACVDAESDGQPTSAADGDDASGGNPIFGTCGESGDEDGVSFTSGLLVGETASVEVVANAPCVLSAWVDFNADGDWADPGESLFPGGQSLAAGSNALTFAVPAGVEEGETYARFRCTTDGAVSFTGEASDGEVEDYRVAIGPIDFGDAPDPGYPTMSASVGASHLLGSDVYLGSCVDAEGDGQPTLAADGDDASAGVPVFGTCAGDDDEDGVTFTSDLLAGQDAGVEVVASSACTLTAWVDFNADGDWTDAGESLFPGGQALAAGSNALSFAVPAEAEGGETYARFRCTTAGPVAFDELASDGEVEDYQVALLVPVRYLPVIVRDH